MKKISSFLFLNSEPRMFIYCLFWNMKVLAFTCHHRLICQSISSYYWCKIYKNTLLCAQHFHWCLLPCQLSFSSLFITERESSAKSSQPNSAAIRLQNSSLSVYWPKVTLIYLFSKVHCEYFLFQYYGCSRLFVYFSSCFFFLSLSPSARSIEALTQPQELCFSQWSKKKYPTAPSMV